MCDGDYDYGSEFQCNDGMLVGCHAFCDDVWDCAHGEDEVDCATFHASLITPESELGSEVQFTEREGYEGKRSVVQLGVHFGGGGWGVKLFIGK